MANLKNWLPPMSRDEMAWFDKCPKSVLFEIARQFAYRIGGDFSEPGALSELRAEWEILFQNEIVPQKPPKRSTSKIDHHGEAA